MMATTITTALLAVTVFVLTQSFLKMVLELLQDQRELIGEVAHALLFYGIAYHPPGFGPPSDPATGRDASIQNERAALLRAALDYAARLASVPNEPRCIREYLDLRVVAA